MNNSHFSAIELNNQAGCLLDKGDLQGAITTLGKAFQASKLMLSTSHNRNHQQTTTSMDSNMIFSALHHDKENLEDPQEGFLYRRPIYIPSTLPANFESSISIACSIIFNLALAHQLMETDHKIAPIMLRQAAGLYEQALKLQLRIRPSALFTMATINNLAFVHRALNDTVTYGRYLEHLLSVLMHATQCGQGKATNFEGYFLNTSHLIFSQSKTAAAA